MGNVKSTIIHKDDDYKYCGEVVHTKGRWYAEGKGCFESKGYIYTGTFKQNQIWGVGTCTYADGIVYTGSWKTGFKHGKGKLQFPAGDCYEGEFKFDSIHGKGKYVYLNGTYYTGKFSNNEMTGMGKLYSSTDKLLYSGEWLHDMFHGYGTYYYPNGKIHYQGHWKQSKADGPGMFKDNTGHIWRGYFKQGEYVGDISISDVVSTVSSPVTVVVYEEDTRSPKSTDPPEKLSFRPCSIRQKDITVVNPIHSITLPNAVTKPSESNFIVPADTKPSVKNLKSKSKSIVIHNPLMGIRPTHSS